ncbi:MAG: RNA-binding protein [Schwartzia sp.]|nr:RNA-binding protein [Schwartzia sp. (in: firmicutes)]
MTTAREKIARFYRGTEGEAVAVRLVDLAEQAARTGKFRCSGFLDPYGIEIAETVAANYGDISVSFDGGYSGAERQRAIFAHRDFGGSPSFDISVVRAEWNAEFAHLAHRDVLGALMGLGVERDTIGDILVAAGSARVLADKKMAAFLLSEWKEIGAAAVRVEADSAESIAPREERVKEIRATVASLRADSVAAAGFGISRSRAASDIEAEKLKLNWQSVKNAAQTVKEGDVLSMRGRGRVEVAEVRGKTKKGRIGISLRRYL